jgi:hypothetical protein
MQQLAPLIALLVVVAFLYIYWTSTQPRTNADKKEKAEDKSASAPESKHDADVKPTVDDKKQSESDLQ